MDLKSSILKASAKKGPASESRSGLVLSEPMSPSVYDFIDYRDYLKSFLDFKKLTNKSYSASMFARRAGLGTNSRGYLKLVIEKKRNLSPQTIRSFSEALALSAQESLYFENMVLFNQAEKDKDKSFYFDRLVASNRGEKPKLLELLHSGVEYHTHWYYFAIRELVAIKDFRDDPAWIASQLREKVKKEQVVRAMESLNTLGLIKRDEETKKWKQSDPLVRFNTDFFNSFTQKFHLEMIERSKESILTDDYSGGHTSGVTLSCAIERLPEIKRAIITFTDQLVERFGVEDIPPDSVIQINMHLFQLTKPKYPKENKP